MTSAAEEIHQLLKENMYLFEMQSSPDSPVWRSYVHYIDSVVSDIILRTIGCRFE